MVSLYAFSLYYPLGDCFDQSWMLTRRVTFQHTSLNRVARSVNRVWMLSYECAGIAQAGGLGEAVAGLARTLSSDYGLRVTVLLPSHGRHSDPRLKEAYGLREETRFIGQGSRIGVNGISYRFLSGIETGVNDNVRFVLVKGLDTK